MVDFGATAGNVDNVKASFEKLNNEIDQGADERAINQAIKESGIDVETITEQTMMAFREKYLKEEN